MKKVKIWFAAALIISICLYLFTCADYALYFIAANIIYVIYALFTVYVSGRNFDIEFHVSGKSKKGELIPVSMIVKNTSFFPVFRADIVISVENAFTDTIKSEHFTVSLLPRKNRVFEFAFLEKYAGCVTIKASEIYVKDSFGLFGRKSVKCAEAKTYIFPAIFELSISRDALLSYDMESFKYSRVKAGGDLSEVFDIREYRQGDNIKGIHWKLSGKEGELMVKVPSLPVENSLMIILDKNLRSISELEGIKSEDEKCRACEHSGELFLSISESLIKQGLSHSIGWYDSSKSVFEYKHVYRIDDIYSAVPLMVSSPFRDDVMSAADRFIDADLKKEYAAFIYVTDCGDAEKEVERLRTYGEVYIYRPENYK